MRANGTGFDRHVVAGQLEFGGTLKHVSGTGLGGQAGQSVDLFDGGGAGRFDDLDVNSLPLGAGARLDFSGLYVAGVVRVVGIQPIPEPGPWAMGLAGLAVTESLRRRRRATAISFLDRVHHQPKEFMK
jgi:MYXO-CTERM domain-containing protein